LTDEKKLKISNHGRKCCIEKGGRNPVLNLNLGMIEGTPKRTGTSPMKTDLSYGERGSSLLRCEEKGLGTVPDFTLEKVLKRRRTTGNGTTNAIRLQNPISENRREELWVRTTGSTASGEKCYRVGVRMVRKRRAWAKLGGTTLTAKRRTRWEVGELPLMTDRYPGRNPSNAIIKELKKTDQKVLSTKKAL